MEEVGVQWALYGAEKNLEWQLPHFLASKSFEMRWLVMASEFIPGIKCLREVSWDSNEATMISLSHEELDKETTKSHKTS